MIKRKTWKRIFFHLHDECLMSILFFQTDTSYLLFRWLEKVLNIFSQIVGFMAISYGTIRKKSKSSIFGGPIILTYSHTPPLNMTKTIISHSWIVIWVVSMVLPITNNSPLKIGQAPQRQSIPNHQFVGLLACSAGG